jgi:D-alanyl-D-alanine carboxypeptidase (penicillin-binding protein 5/6)
VSEKAWKKGGSKMFVKIDTKVSVNDLLKGVIVQSGNDATIVLAEGIAGSEDKFAEYLNKIAKKLGMKNSNFVNASGWPDENHYSTARDLSVLAIHTINDFPKFYKYYSETEFTYNKITQQNRNPLLSMDIGSDGIKTGHTDIAGYGLIASAVNPKDGRRVVVVFNGTDSKKSRAKEAEKLVVWGLNGFKNKKFIDAKLTTYKVPALYGKQSFINAAVKKDLILTIDRISDSEFTSKFTPKPNLTAPISKNDIVGVIEILHNNKHYKSIDVIAKENLEELGAFKRFFAKTKNSIMNREK